MRTRPVLPGADGDGQREVPEPGAQGQKLSSDAEVFQAMEQAAKLEHRRR